MPIKGYHRMTMTTDGHYILNYNEMNGKNNRFMPQRSPAHVKGWNAWMEQKIMI